MSFYVKLEELMAEAEKEGINAVVAFKDGDAKGAFFSEKNYDKSQQAVITAQQFHLHNKNRSSLLSKLKLLLGDRYDTLMTNIENSKTADDSLKANQEFENEVIRRIGKDKFDIIFSSIYSMPAKNSLDKLMQVQEIIETI